MKHAEAAQKKKQLVEYMVTMKDVLYGDFKMPLAKARKDKAWGDVRLKAIEIGIITATKTLSQLKRNYIHSTINLTKEKLRASRQTGNGSNGAPVFTELDNAVLDLIGRDTDAALVDVPGGRSATGWGEPSDSASSSSGDESPPRKRRRTVPEVPSRSGPSSSCLQPGSRPRPGSRERSPDRKALETRYHRLLSMPDSQRTVAERAEVRQILVVKILTRKVETGATSLGVDTDGVAFL